jgi:hypothetical protein
MLTQLKSRTRSVLDTIGAGTRSVLDTVSARGGSMAEAGKKKAADLRRARQRDSLLRELGQLYYDAIREGRDGVIAESRDKVIADLDALGSDDEAAVDEASVR